MQELVQLTWVFSRSFRKASAKNSCKLNKFLHGEVNQLIQHIIVQDQDGQNNNMNYEVPHCGVINNINNNNGDNS